MYSRFVKFAEHTKPQPYHNIPEVITDMSSIRDFNFVKEAGFEDIYNALVPAMKYYESDYEQSCINFRYVFVLTLSEVEKITGFRTKGKLENRVSENCQFLQDRDLMDDTMHKEFWVVKRIADKYHHKEANPNLDPKKDRYTFYCAFMEIFKWLIELPGRLEEYNEEINRRKRKEEEDAENKRQLRKQKRQEVVKWIKKILPWFGYILAGIAAGFGIGHILESQKEDQNKSSTFNSDSDINENL